MTEDVHAADALVDATKAKRLVMVAATPVITTISLSQPCFRASTFFNKKAWLVGALGFPDSRCRCCDRFRRLLVRFAGNPH